VVGDCGCRLGVPLMATFEIDPSNPSYINAAQACDRASSGDTIFCRPGVYRGEEHMLTRLPEGVTARGELGMQTLFDGVFLHRPVRAARGSSVIGIQACNSSSGYVATRAPESHFGQCEFWQDPHRFTHSNHHVFSADECDDATSDEVACFGYGRKMHEVYRSSRVVDRHMWIRYDGYPEKGKASGFSYKSSSVHLRDSIVSLGGTSDARVAPLDNEKVYLLASDPQELGTGTGIKIINTLVIDQRSESIRPVYGVDIDGLAEVELRNVHVVVRPGVIPFRLNGGGSHDGCWASNDLSQINPAWTQHGNFNVGVYEARWPILPDSMWERIMRATEWSRWPKAVRPEDSL
jgi:hypothetical protein